MDISTIIQILFNSLRTGSIVALAGLGIVLIYRTSKATNFAQGSIGTINAFVAGYIAHATGLSIWTSTLIALGTAFLTGVIIDKLFIRPAGRTASPVNKQILTLGIILILTGIMNMNIGILGDLFTPRYPEQFISSSERVMILGRNIQWNTIFIVALSIFLLSAIFLFIQKTRWGLAIRVTASNETAARLMGVPTKTVTMIAWAVAAMLGTIAGIALAPRAPAGLNPGLLIGTQVSAFFAAVFGGFQSFFGPVFAAYIIGFLLSAGRYGMSSYFGQPSIIADLIIYLVILIILYFKPFGIFGKAPERKV